MLEVIPFYQTWWYLEWDILITEESHVKFMINFLERAIVLATQGLRWKKIEQIDITFYSMIFKFFSMVDQVDRKILLYKESHMGERE